MFKTIGKRNWCSISFEETIFEEIILKARDQSVDLFLINGR